MTPRTLPRSDVKLLIVDDDPTTRVLLSEALEGGAHAFERRHRRAAQRTPLRCPRGEMSALGRSGGAHVAGVRDPGGTEEAAGGCVVDGARRSAPDS